MGEGGEKLAPKVDLGKGKGLAGTGLFPVAWREKRRFVNRCPDERSEIRVPASRISLRYGRTLRVTPDHSCNCRFKSSISSASALSVFTRFSILRTACSTVV